MQDISKLRRAIEATGTQVAFVHMQPPEEADDWFARYGIGDITRFNDPEHRLYKAFDLEAGSLFELAHPRVWGRWFRTAIRRGAGFQGKHWRQLTGVFVIDRDRVLGAIRHRNSAARPDYLAFVQRSLSQR